jgi:DNA-binding transcriptional MocR family regulator
VTNHDLVAHLLRDMGDPRLVQFGAAIPNPELLPLARLSRTLVGVVRADERAGGLFAMTPGYEPLRAQIARRALTAGCTLAPDEIVVTNGAQEAIDLCLRAVCRPGDTIAVESPVYYGILQAVEGYGLRALPVATHPRDGVDVAALENALVQNAVRACVLISNFHNPLGGTIPEATKRALAAMLARRGVPLIENDVFGDLVFGAERPKCVKAFDTTGDVLLCSSFSKTIAPGYRIGWVAAGRYQQEVEHAKIVTSLATSTPPQMAVAALLENGGYDHHLRRIRRVYAQRTAAMAHAVARHFPEGTKVTRPGGGFVLWVELPEDVDSVALYGAALRKNITIAPGPLFSARGQYRNCVRLNTAFFSERTEWAVEALGVLVAEARGTAR